MYLGHWHRVPNFSRVRLLAGLAVLALLAACLDIPSTPKPENTVSHVSVYVVQEGKADSSFLKIHPGSSATLRAEIDPMYLESKLQFGWYRDTLMGEESSYTIPPRTSWRSIPNKLVVTDREGNSVSVNFSVTVNSPPKFSQEFHPAQGDTLFGTKSTAFTFSWKAEDNEDAILDYALELDTTRYSVGALEKIQQSGLEPGTHLFRVIVRDSQGDLDSLPLVKFYVVDTLEALK
jgi:hypothetical protein